MCQLRDHAPLVRRLAIQQLAKLSANVELDDLVQVGMIGLHEAIERWQDKGEAQFESYAITRIKGAMLDEVRRGDHLPRRVRQKLRAVDSAAQLLAHKYSRRARDSEIAEALSMPVREYQRLVAQNAVTVSLEDAHDMPDDAMTPEQSLQRMQQCEAVLEAIAQLNDRERWILNLYYRDDMTLKDIGTLLGVNESRVCQMLKDTVLRLRVMVEGC